MPIIWLNQSTCHAFGDLSTILLVATADNAVYLADMRAGTNSHIMRGMLLFTEYLAKRIDVRKLLDSAIQLKEFFEYTPTRSWIMVLGHRQATSRPLYLRLSWSGNRAKP